MTPASATTSRFDVQAVRAEFPTLSRQVHGKPLVYLDNGATTQKPVAVIAAITKYYESHNANVHRGVHALSVEATELYEAVRPQIARFINAPSDRQIVFTRGTTESINLVAQSYGRSTLKPGDEVIISAMEHHSGIVPWQIVCEQTGATLRVIPMNDRGELLLDDYDKLLSERTRIVSVVHVSNALGTINPVKLIAQMARDRAPGCVVLIDGAQWVGHFPLDVQEIDCDFYAFSGHKLFGPTGVGVLYGRRELLEAMPPWQGGGDMILSVTFEKTIYNDVPLKFEAGTPHIAGVIGLGAAVDYLASLDRDAAAAHEHDLLEYGTARLSEIDGLRLIGTAAHKASILSFVLDFAHPLDAGTIMDRSGVAVRTGHHCAQPVMDRLGIPATIRASLAFYNTRDDIDALVDSIEKVRRLM
jgi:cysteine desulfurase/selenocysteine lyase